MFVSWPASFLSFYHCVWKPWPNNLRQTQQTVLDRCPPIMSARYDSSPAILVFFLVEMVEAKCNCYTKLNPTAIIEGTTTPKTRQQEIDKVKAAVWSRVSSYTKRQKITFNIWDKMLVVSWAQKLGAPAAESIYCDWTNRILWGVTTLNAEWHWIYRFMAAGSVIIVCHESKVCWVVGLFVCSLTVKSIKRTSWWPTVPLIPLDALE